MEKQPKFDYSDIKFKDNGKLKLIIVVGTRPEIIRLAAVITKCRQYFDVILAHTGQATNVPYRICKVRKICACSHILSRLTSIHFVFIIHLLD